ncbi:MAG: LysR family transcriptional regulator [Acidimicrobiales bacterium]|jgi:DNA-binding transcriptional LysR family regulator
MPERSVWSIDKGVGLRELRALLAVADLGSFRRAAAELGYTQSSISHQVASLERALGTELFTRPGGRGAVKLTTGGAAVYRRARRALGEVEAIGADIDWARRGERTRIRVGVSQTAAAELMPAALRSFRETQHDVEVILSEVEEIQAIVSGLGRGRLDLAFVLNPEPDERVEAIPLLEDRWVILTRRDSALGDVEHLSFDLIDGMELVAWTRRWSSQIELEEAWRRRGIAPRIVYRTDDNLALQRLVAAGLGHACIGQLAARRAVDSSLTWLAPRERLTPRQIALCYPRHRELTGAVAALISAIRANSTG